MEGRPKNTPIHPLFEISNAITLSRRINSWILPFAEGRITVKGEGIAVDNTWIKVNKPRGMYGGEVTDTPWLDQNSYDAGCGELSMARRDSGVLPRSAVDKALGNLKRKVPDLD